ncbi:hypothetical protein [Methylocystis parvus]|uniref:hypothetical protein n=1 Tax=Methylocystis parvus TaxID=134 RepID=UPI003C7911A2
MTQLAYLHEVAASAKWPYGREEMVFAPLIILRMSDDLETLDALGEAPSPESLAALGWPSDIVAAHYDDAARAADVSISIARMVRAERRDAPAAQVEPVGQSSGPENDNARAANFFDARQDALRREARAFLAGTLGGLLASFLLARAVEFAWRLGQ